MPSATSEAQKTITDFCPPLHLTSLKKKEKKLEMNSGHDKSLIFNDDEVSLKQEMTKNNLMSPYKTRKSSIKVPLN